MFTWEAPRAVLGKRGQDVLEGVTRDAHNAGAQEKDDPRIAELQ